MNKMFLMLILVSIGFIYAQEPWEDASNDNHSTDVTADEIINNEPIVISEIIGSTTNDTPDNTPEMDMTISVETYYTEYARKITIPLWYRFRDFGVSASIPFFIAKEEPMSGESLSGIGDISLGFSYGKYLEEQNTYLDFNFTAKMPTGDPEAETDDGINIALGSDTWDFTGAASAYYFMDDFTFKGNLVYTMNGKYTDALDAENDRGDNFLFVAGADYRWQYRLIFGVNANYGIHFNSESDGTEGTDKLVFMDIKPVVKYPISLFEFVLGAKIPIYTDTPDNSFNEGDRNMAFFFRANYQLF
ncbi:MAG: transporter [Candidatus Delongbacteria bacterium]|jgi:hypothetical protein|nr:transporter [Candidatus Delongbacteria bacterium]